MSYLARWGLRFSVLAALVALAPVAHAQGTIYLGDIAGGSTTNLGRFRLVDDTSGGLLGCSAISTAASCAGTAINHSNNSIIINWSVHRGVLELDFTTAGGGPLITETGSHSGSLAFKGATSTLPGFSVYEAGSGSTRIKMNPISLAINATCTPSANCNSTLLGDITATETVTNATSTTSFSVNGNTQASPLVPVGNLASGSNTVNINQSLGINNPSGSGVTLSLLTITQRYYGVPEPLTIGVFGVGLAGLAAFRRRRAVQRHQLARG